MKILVTGFEPFDGEKLNPSQLLLKALSSQKDVKTLLLPVSYRESFSSLQALYQKEKFDFVLHLGQAGRRTHVCLEQFAHNWSGARTADEEGVLKSGEVIDSKAPLSYSPNLNLEALRDYLRKKEIPTEISINAGGFICNYVYFRSLQLAAPALFMHVPYLPIQVLDKGDAPSMGLELMRAAVINTLQFVRDAKP